MNVKNLIAAVSILAATGSAFAQGNSEFVEFLNVPSTKTRAEVQAELAQATRTPEFVEHTNVASVAPRTATVASRMTYDQSLLNHGPEFVEHLNVASTKSRAEVRDEVVQATKASRTSIGG